MTGFEAVHARYWHRPESEGGASIEVQLEPFVFLGERVETCIRLDGIAGLDADLSAAAGRVFEFPCNPEPGYIDGSVYLQGRHHPVDVTQLSFGHLADGAMPLKMIGTVIQEGHGNAAPVPLELPIVVLLPLSRDAIERLAAEAISAVNATSPKDLGKVMASLTPGLLYPEQAAQLASVLSRLLAA